MWSERIADWAGRAIGTGAVGWERMRTGVAFNPFDARLYSDPYPLYARLRERDPVHASALIGGWVLSRYEDVSAALRDPRLSADERTNPGYEKHLRRLRRRGLLGPDEVPEASMLRRDPPDHTRLRRLVSKGFTPRAVRRLDQRIDALVAELLDAAAGKDEIDVLRDLAAPLPVIVIAELIGVPPRDRARFRHWSDEIVRGLGISSASDERASLEASAELRAYFTEIAEQRRIEPRDDLMSALLAVEDEGDRLNRNELLSTLELLLIAGNETTANLIGNGLLALLRSPEQLEALRRSPEQLATGVDELVRFDGPVQATGRIAREDLEIGGRSVRRGQEVILLLGSANRDPEAFRDPDRLDLTRSDNPHLGFGHGVHFCLGANLARLETRRALAGLLERFPTLKLASDDLRWRRNMILHGVEALPIRV